MAVEGPLLPFQCRAPHHHHPYPWGRVAPGLRARTRQKGQGWGWGWGGGATVAFCLMRAAVALRGRGGGGPGVCSGGGARALGSPCHAPWPSQWSAAGGPAGHALGHAPQAPAGATCCAPGVGGCGPRDEGGVRVAFSLLMLPLDFPRRMSPRHAPPPPSVFEWSDLLIPPRIPEIPVRLHCPSLYRVLPPVRWLLDLHCACVGRRLGSREPAKLGSCSAIRAPSGLTVCVGHAGHTFRGCPHQRFALDHRVPRLPPPPECGATSSQERTVASVRSTSEVEVAKVFLHLHWRRCAATRPQARAATRLTVHVRNPYDCMDCVRLSPDSQADSS